MLLHIISYALHLLIIIPFFILLPFPMFIRGHELQSNLTSLVKILKFYKVILLVAHIALVIALVTGLILRFQFSLWVTGVIIIWIAIGAFLGYTAKYVQLLLDEIASKKKTLESLEGTKKYSRLLTIAIASMFVLKYVTLYM